MSSFHASLGKICTYRPSFACPNGSGLLQIECACHIKVGIKMGCEHLRNAFLLQFTWRHCCLNAVQMMWVLISISKLAYQIRRSEKKMARTILKTSKISSNQEEDPWTRKLSQGLLTLSCVLAKNYWNPGQILWTSRAKPLATGKHGFLAPGRSAHTIYSPLLTLVLLTQEATGGRATTHKLHPISAPWTHPTLAWRSHRSRQENTGAGVWFAFSGATH